MKAIQLPLARFEHFIMSENTLSSYLTDDSPHISVAQEIETILRIGERFPATCNIVERLIELLETEGLEDMPNPEKRAAWLSSLIQINTAGIAAGWVKAANTPRSGNPLGGQFGRYPAAAFLLQESTDIADLQTKGIAILYLMALMNNSLSSKSLENTAHTLRQAIAPSSNHIRFMSQFPKFTSYSKYYDSCSSHVTTKKGSDIRGERDILHSLSRLFNPSQRPVKPKNINPDICSPKPSWETHHPIQNIGGIDANLSDGHIANTLISTEGVDKGEAPQAKLLFVTPEPEDQKNTAPDEAEIDAGARESRLWISRHQRLVHNVTGRFTPPERRHIAAFLHKELTSEVNSRQITGGLLGLMYLMGRDLESVCKTKINNLRNTPGATVWQRNFTP